MLTISPAARVMHLDTYTVNAGRKRLWTNILNAMREGRRRNFFSTDNPLHIFMHEIGELAMHQSVGGDRYYPYGEEYLQDKRAHSSNWTSNTSGP